jgi:hypothetical protein
MAAAGRALGGVPEFQGQFRVKSGAVRPQFGSSRHDPATMDIGAYLILILIRIIIIKLRLIRNCIWSVGS